MTRRPRLCLFLAAPVALSFAGLAAGCGPADEPTPVESAASVASDPSEVSGVSSEPEVPADQDSVRAEAVVVPRLVEPDSVRTFRLWLINRHAAAVVVRAEAGAASVTVDSIPVRDSARVNLEVRADSVWLSSHDDAGTQVGSTWLYPSQDSVVRHELP